MATLLAPNPSVFTGRGTNTYILGAGDRVVVIDPGDNNRDHLDAVATTAEGMGKPAAVLVTHHHPDHVGGAVELASRLRVPLMGYPHRLAPAFDEFLAHDDRVDVGEGHLKVVHTPGHASDHVCLFWEEAGIVFAGDLVAGEGYIVIDPPDGSMSAYLESLAAIRDLAAGRILPGHGPAIDDPAGYLDGYIAHRLEREAKVLAAIPPGEAVNLEAILPIAYDDTPKAMYPAAERSLLAHLDKLVADKALWTEGEPGSLMYRRLEG